MKAYLAGMINGDKIKPCIEWRERIALYYLKKAWDIIWLDPLNGQAIATITPDGLKSSIPPKALVSRDIKCIKDSDLIIANLDTFGETRTPTGTLSEIAIAYMLNKPTIVITKDIQYKEHPFIKEFASIIVESVDELLSKNYIQYYYRGTVTARYE